MLIELKKNSLINIDDLEEELRIPILALIPNFDKSILRRINKSIDDKDKFVTLRTDKSGIRESYRLLNTKLSQLDLRDKTIMVTSCEENTGKTTIVANLAITMALNDKNILIIDCDLRKGELSKMFNVFHNSPGLIDYLEKGGSPAIYTRVLKKINIIPSGGLRENSSILELGGGSEQSVASALHMTTRTLHRRLRERVYSFRSLLVEVRKDLVRRYMEDRSLSLTDIAFMLGYNDASAFSRAFRGWFGKSPSAMLGRG